MTPAERKSAERQRRKDAGLVRVEMWVRPEDVAAVKAAVEAICTPHQPEQSTARL